MSDVSGVNSATQAYAASQQTSKAPNKADAKADTKTTAEVGAVYEKSSGSADSKAPYSINKMSANDRAALVEQLKADQNKNQQQLANIVSEMLGKQAKTFGQATDMWKFLASGQFEVDEATKAQAQKDIGEDGYWGVKQTSQRLFDFASALAGDDVEKMQKMQSAIEKGYKMATKAWGQDLPDISNDTMAATNQLFEDYYASKKAEA